MEKPEARVAMQNIKSPGHVFRVDAAKYEAMKRAILSILPRESPGLTVAELKQRVLPQLPEHLYPGGARAGWWLKGVQLDLEARGMIVREDAKPLRLHAIRHAQANRALGLSGGPKSGHA